jgi:hypothetical protein
MLTYGSADPVQWRVPVVYKRRGEDRGQRVGIAQGGLYGWMDNRVEGLEGRDRVETVVKMIKERDNGEMNELAKKYRLDIAEIKRLEKEKYKKWAEKKKTTQNEPSYQPTANSENLSKQAGDEQPAPSSRFKLKPIGYGFLTIPFGGKPTSKRTTDEKKASFDPLDSYLLVEDEHTRAIVKDLQSRITALTQRKPLENSLAHSKPSVPPLKLSSLNSDNFKPGLSSLSLPKTSYKEHLLTSETIRDIAHRTFRRLTPRGIFPVDVKEPVVDADRVIQRVKKSKKKDPCVEIYKQSMKRSLDHDCAKYSKEEASHLTSRRLTNELNDSSDRHRFKESSELQANFNPMIPYKDPSVYSNLIHLRSSERSSLSNPKISAQTHLQPTVTINTAHQTQPKIDTQRLPFLYQCPSV